jgi:glucokinase
MAEARYLISDIGGTNIRLASFITDPRQRLDEKTYKLDPKTCKPFEVLTAIKDYVAGIDASYKAACLGVAGRVRGDEVQITNRPDKVRRADVAAVLKLPPERVLLVNDMPPHLASVDKLVGHEAFEIKPGAGDPEGSRAVLMPGTGVGVGGAVSIAGRGHLPFPSEGGHVDFAPRDAEQDRLLVWMRKLAKKFGTPHVSNEFVFCGEGIRRIYSFLTSPDSPDLAAVRSEQITAAVTSGEAGPDDPRRKTIDLYLKILGAAAGNLALMFTATGGVYLGGSICLQLRKELSAAVFRDAFLSSGPPQHRALLDDVPVRLIDYADSGLLGSGVLAMHLDR